MTEEQQDYFIADCILELIDEGTSLQECRYVVAAAQKFYGHRRRFGTSSRVLEGLSSRNPPVQAAPFPAPLLMALVVLLAAAKQEGVATALLLAFCGLLRISEAINLRLDDVLLPEHHFGGCYVVLLLRQTKRGAPHSDRVIIGNARVVSWITAFAQRRSQWPGRQFCGISYSRVRYWLRKGLMALGFPPDSFRSHSCRRGGATALSLAGVPFVDVQLAGRWASAQSCKLYIKRAEVALTRFTHTVSPNDWQRLEMLACIGDRVFKILPLLDSLD